MSFSYTGAHLTAFEAEPQQQQRAVLSVVLRQPNRVPNPHFNPRQNTPRGHPALIGFAENLGRVACRKYAFY